MGTSVTANRYLDTIAPVLVQAIVDAPDIPIPLAVTPDGAARIDATAILRSESIAIPDGITVTLTLTHQRVYYGLDATVNQHHRNSQGTSVTVTLPCGNLQAPLAATKTLLDALAACPAPATPNMLTTALTATGAALAVGFDGLWQYQGCQFAFFPTTPEASNQ